MKVPVSKARLLQMIFRPLHIDWRSVALSMEPVIHCSDKDTNAMDHRKRHIIISLPYRNCVELCKLAFNSSFIHKPVPIILWWPIFVTPWMTDGWHGSFGKISRTFVSSKLQAVCRIYDNPSGDVPRGQKLHLGTSAFVFLTELL